MTLDNNNKNHNNNNSKTKPASTNANMRGKQNGTQSRSARMPQSFRTCTLKHQSTKQKDPKYRVIRHNAVFAASVVLSTKLPSPLADNDDELFGIADSLTGGPRGIYDSEVKSLKQAVITATLASGVQVGDYLLNLILNTFDICLNPEKKYDDEEWIRRICKLKDPTSPSESHITCNNVDLTLRDMDKISNLWDYPQFYDFCLDYLLSWDFNNFDLSAFDMGILSILYWLVRELILRSTLSNVESQVEGKANHQPTTELTYRSDDWWKDVEKISARAWQSPQSFLYKCINQWLLGLAQREPPLNQNWFQKCPQKDQHANIRVPGKWVAKNLTKQHLLLDNLRCISIWMMLGRSVLKLTMSKMLIKQQWPTVALPMIIGNYVDFNRQCVLVSGKFDWYREFQAIYKVKYENVKASTNQTTNEKPTFCGDIFGITMDTPIAFAAFEETQKMYNNVGGILEAFWRWRTIRIAAQPVFAAIESISFVEYPKLWYGPVSPAPLQINISNQPKVIPQLKKNSGEIWDWVKQNARCFAYDEGKLHGDRIVMAKYLQNLKIPKSNLKAGKWKLWKQTHFKTGKWHKMTDNEKAKNYKGYVLSCFKYRTPQNSNEFKLIEGDSKGGKWKIFNKVLNQTWPLEKHLIDNIKDNQGIWNSTWCPLPDLVKKSSIVDETAPQPASTLTTNNSCANGIIDLLSDDSDDSEMDNGVFNVKTEKNEITVKTEIKNTQSNHLMQLRPKQITLESTDSELDSVFGSMSSVKTEDDETKDATFVVTDDQLVGNDSDESAAVAPTRRTQQRKPIGQRMANRATTRAKVMSNQLMNSQRAKNPQVTLGKRKNAESSIKCEFNGRPQKKPRITQNLKTKAKLTTGSKAKLTERVNWTENNKSKPISLPNFN